MRVLVTGAFGYVGNAVARSLSHGGHQVTAMTSRPGAVWSGPQASVVVADLRDKASLRAVVDGADAVVHLAALTRVRESFERPDDYAAVNARGTANLIDALAEARLVVPFVHASTAAIYGTPEVQPISEDADEAPTNPYGETKLAADIAVRVASLNGQLAGVSIRAFNIAGAVERHGDPDLTRIIPKAVAVAAGRFDEVTVNGDGSAIRDYVHVADLATAITLALSAAQPGQFNVYNVGATPATVAEIIGVARAVTGAAIPARHNPPAPEAPELRANTSRIRAQLGWQPTRSTLHRIVSDAWDAERSGA